MPVPPAGQVRCGGFTLIELAVVLFILTLLFAGALTPLTQQLTEHQNTQTQHGLQAMKSALLGYAMSHRDAENRPYLPCPDLNQPGTGGSANDGVEDRRPDGGCQSQVGNSPWITLGMPESDAWGHRYTYAVSAAFTQADRGLAAWPEPAAELRICLAQGCASQMRAAALLLSHGRNGLGAVNQLGRRNQAPGGGDEVENSDGDLEFVHRPPTAAGRPGGEFDDLALVLSGPYLLGQLCGRDSGC